MEAFAMWSFLTAKSSLKLSDVVAWVWGVLARRLGKGYQESGKRILKSFAIEFSHYTVGDGEIFNGGSRLNRSIHYYAVSVNSNLCYDNKWPLNLHDFLFQSIFLAYIINWLWVMCSPVLCHSLSETQTHKTTSFWAIWWQKWEKGHLKSLTYTQNFS